MAGTIYSGIDLNGIVLADPATQRPATVTGSVSNKNGDAIYGKPVARWIVANSGTIENTGTAGYGIDLAARGTVENGVSGAIAALISGYGGVVIRGALATVGNLGTISGTGSKRDGVELKVGGQVTNGSTAVTAALISGGRHAVVIRNAAGTVANFGTLTNSGTYGVADLFAGGSLTNGSSASSKALIEGSGNGVYIAGGAGTATNFATINGSWGVVLHAGGQVINKSGASISATAGNGVTIAEAPGTVTNFGMIDGGSGAVLRAGGTVENRTGGRIIADKGNGVGIEGAAGTVTNLGTISGAENGISLARGGSIVNGNIGDTAALVKGTVWLKAGSVSNFGTIEDGGGVFLESKGTVVNGSASSTAAYIESYSNAVEFLTSSGTVVNFGTFKGRNLGVFGEAGTITNYGLIEGQSNGIFWESGQITNFGTISSVESAYGSNTTLTNFGTIVGYVSLFGHDKVVVESGASFLGKITAFEGASAIDFETGGVADVSNVSGFSTITLGNGKSHSLTLTDANFGQFAKLTAITVHDGDSGNAVSATTLPAADHIIVHAGSGLDTLTGGAGNDVFYAGGDTVMTGGAGRNRFIFSAPGNNTVGDFAVSATNEIVFSDKGFNLGLSGASGTPQALPAGLFVENSDGHFTGTSQNFAYAIGTGDLFYSASGSSGTPALVSHFTNAPALAASQLLFIA